MSLRLLAGVGRGALLVAGALVIALAALTLGARLALPFAERWKDEIEVGLADYLDRPVSIESLSFRWRGTGPELRAQGVIVAEDERRRVSIDEALIDLDLASSLLRRSLVFDELTLVGADIALERDARGRWSVRAVGGARTAPAVRGGAGAVRPARSADEGLAWLFDARRVGLLDTRLALVDAESGPIVALEALDLRVENDGAEHRMRLAASLPPALGGELELGVDLASGMRDAVARRATGRFHARATSLRPAALAQVAAEIAPPGSVPVAPLDARVAVELWGTLDAGRLDAVRGRAEAREVRALGAPRGAPASLDLVAGAFRFERTAAVADAGWRLVADGASAVRGDRRTELDVLRAERAGGELVVEAGGEDLPVALASALPLALAASAGGPLELAGLEPRGTLERWSVAYRPGRGPGGLDVSALGRALATSATGPLPGVDALDLELSISAGRGRARLSAALPAGLSIDAPRVDAEPIALDRLEAELRIDLRPAGAATASVSGPVALEGAGATLAARAALALEPGRSPQVSLSGRFAARELERVPTLLPDRLLGPATIDWFERAFVAGRVADGEILLSGRLADFPWSDGSGVFRADAELSGVELDWLPGWPVARGLAGSVRVDGTSIEGRVDAGRVGALALGRGGWRIENVVRPGLALELSSVGALPAMLDFATGGPLAGILAPALGDVSGEGEAGLDVAVSVPLSRAARRAQGPLAVDGTVFLSDNALRFGRADIDLEGATGAIGFDEAGVDIHRLRGRWLGRPLVVALRTSGEGAARAARLTVDGALEASDVLAHYALPLDGFVSGASSWRAELVAPFDPGALERDGVTLELASDLVGTGIDLPVPLGKPSARARPFALRAAFRPGEETVRWSVDAGEGAQAVEVHADVGESGLEALALGLGGARASAAGVPGVRVDGTVGTLALDAWAEALGALIEALPEANGEPAPIVAVSGHVGADALTLFGAPLGPARLRLNADGAYLNAALDNALLRGNARWPRRADEGRAALVRLARVDAAVVDALLDGAEPAAVASAGDGEGAGDAGAADPIAAVPPGGPDPRSLPPIRARVGSLGWGETTVANLVLRTEPDVAGLRIDTLGFTHENLQLIGEGYWRVADPQGTGGGPEGLQRTALSLTLQSGNFGAGLADIGLPGLLAGGAGRATARLGWPGPAWGPALEGLGGALRFELEDGRVVPLDPGAGRLIGLFAFQALPRRFDLDFTDLTDDGLAFSTLTGRAGIEDGVVDAGLVRLAGPVGVIDVTGRTDLVARTFDQRVTVLPRVSAALPVIGAIAGGASAGIGALLAGGLLKALGVDLDRIGLMEYALGGTWEAPTFESR